MVVVRRRRSPSVLVSGSLGRPGRFEQLFINSTNEQLQRLFNDIIFKQEEEEYNREQIEWDKTAFPDNMPCIELLSKKPHGLMRLLDAECMRGMAASDGEKLVSKFNKQHGSHSCERRCCGAVWQCIGELRVVGKALQVRT